MASAEIGPYWAAAAERIRERLKDDRGAQKALALNAGITVIRERRPRARPTTDEEDEDEEEREDAEGDERFAPQKAGGCTFTGLGCLVLLGIPFAIWLLA